jgi:hypothetical protein
LKSEDGSQVVILHCHSFQSVNDPFHALVCEILLQVLRIAHLSPHVERRLLDLKGQTSALSDVAFDTLLEIVETVICDTPKVILVVDGIDELDQQALELKHFLCKLRDLSQPKGLCKVLLVSRNTQSLELLIADWPTMAISPPDSLRDISIFLDQKLKNMVHLGDHRGEIIDRLVEGSKGLILWADLAANELDHLRTWNEIVALLENGNRGLDLTYATIIKQLDTSSKGLCRIRARALLLVAVAVRPFRLEEMIELLAIEASKEFIDPGNKILGGWTTLSRASGPFLQMDELSNIELIHVSAKEFLLTHPWATSLAQEHLIDESPQIEMVCLCLSYLNLSLFGNIGEDMEEDLDSFGQKYPFLKYASQFCKFKVITFGHLSFGPINSAISHHITGCEIELNSSR